MNQDALSKAKSTAHRGGGRGFEPPVAESTANRGGGKGLEPPVAGATNTSNSNESGGSTDGGLHLLCVDSCSLQFSCLSAETHSTHKDVRRI